MEDVLLHVEDLKTYFYTDEGVVPGVDGVSFEVRKGETLAIVGESGCGKSATSLSILRIVQSPPGRIIGGRILFGDVDLLQLSEKKMRDIRGNEISMIFQEPMTSLNPVFTVGEQISQPLRHHQKLDRKQAREKAIRFNRNDPAGRNCRSGTCDRPISPSVLRWNAPAHHDCHGARLPAADPDCGRADHGS